MIKNDTYDAFGRFFMPDILAWIQNEVNPEDVFDREKLKEWALDNGFINISEIEGD
jgi:hypothetical protein